MASVLQLQLRWRFEPKVNCGRNGDGAGASHSLPPLASQLLSLRHYDFRHAVLAVEAAARHFALIIAAKIRVCSRITPSSNWRLRLRSYFIDRIVVEFGVVAVVVAVVVIVVVMDFIVVLAGMRAVVWLVSLCCEAAGSPRDSSAGSTPLDA